jgi:hypothetical protein
MLPHCWHLLAPLDHFAGLQSCLRLFLEQRWRGHTPSYLNPWWLSFRLCFLHCAFDHLLLHAGHALKLLDRGGGWGAWNRSFVCSFVPSSFSALSYKPKSPFELELSLEFTETYTEKYPGASLIIAPNCHDLILMTAAGLRQTNDKKTLSEFFHSIKDFRGAMGTYSATNDNRFTLPATVKVVTETGFEKLISN